MLKKMKGDAMVKKMKRVSVDLSSSYPVDVEAKHSFKHQSLLQDYEELFKETEAMKKKLQRSKQKKLNLLAEVRFLRRRFKYLLKTQSPNIPQERDLPRRQFPEIRIETPAKGRNYREKEPTSQNPGPVFDLNQISKEDESEEFQDVWKPLKIEKKTKKRNRGDEKSNGINLSGTKRKISWQDQVALRV